MPLPLPEYDDLDAIALSALVRKREVSSQELLDAAIARIDARDPALNSVVMKHYDRARTRVRDLPPGPLQGVPFLLKDLKVQLEGTVTTNACKLFRSAIATRSSLIAERYEAAGMQILGKTNAPEFGIMGITEPALWGPCRNPWDLTRTPGGSSGGSGSAVAARLVPAAHGGDGGGSIRIPASANGLFGLKPTRARVSMAPHLGDAWHGMVQEHVLTRSVRDSALLLDLVDEPVAGDPYWAPPKTRPWLDEVGAPPGELRIAYCREAIFVDTQHADCVAAVDDAVQLLDQLGHRVEERRPPFDREALLHAYFIILTAGIANSVDQAARMHGRKPKHSDFEPATWLLALIGWQTPASELEQARQTVYAAGRQMASFMLDLDIDVFVCSTLAQPPAAIGELSPSAQEERLLSLLRRVAFKKVLDLALSKMGDSKFGYTPNTQLFNQTGQPAASIPLYWNAQGIPIGTQFVGRFGDEATLFRLASQLESARPWQQRKPSLIEEN